MRGLTTVTLVLAGLAAHALAHTAPPPLPQRRKSLGFGPVLPHARFETSPPSTAGFAPVSSTDPFHVARDFLSHYVDPAVGRAYTIRSDSYTDHSTGITHIYARQIIGGIEVADGHINLNIKDGRILSFGDSFFPGGAPASVAGEPVHPHAVYCSQLADALVFHQEYLVDSLDTAPQSTLSQDQRKTMDGISTLSHLLESNCAVIAPPPSLYAGENSQIDMDPRRSLLVFMASALPQSHPELETVLENPEKYIQGIHMTPETHLIGEHASIGMVLTNVPGTVGDVKTHVAWVQVPREDGTVQLELVHRFEVEMEHNWYEATVSAALPHRIISVVDWASDSPMPIHGQVQLAKYLVFPWGTNDPEEATTRREKVEGDTLASPVGWHTLPYENDPSIDEDELRAARARGEFWRLTNTTWGNNVFAHENWDGQYRWITNYRPEGSSVTAGKYASLLYAFPYAPTSKDADNEEMDQAKKYIDATVAQLFYTSNMAHDLFYRYGFTEAAGNFQQYNFGRGGAEGDAVIANAQDGSGFNNANFMTPPDGQNGRCRMYLWNTASPYRDGDMEAGIVIHELAHGLSTRLTGGPVNSGCLGWGEAGGMGEGWGDFIGTLVRSTDEYSDYPMGAWASNRDKGIRNYPYSLDPEINPSTYETLDTPGYWGVHAIGEVWAEMLWVVLQRLINKHGFSDTLFPPVPDAKGRIPNNDFYRPQEYDRLGKPLPLVPKHGNTLFLQLVITGMKLQPCSPSFFDARKAILQADEALTGGENQCEIWAGFAERGLGVDANVVGQTPWGGGVRSNVGLLLSSFLLLSDFYRLMQGFEVDKKCHGNKHPAKPAPGNPDEDCGPFGWCWPWKDENGRYKIPKLPGWPWANYY
ncbi:extracellular elastinolytic metallo proteinase [Scleroderma citrinum]